MVRTPLFIIGFLALVALATSTSYAASMPTPSPNGGHILAVTEGPALLKQCSRPAPENVTQFWKPTAADIAKLETTLNKYLLQPNLPVTIPATTYSRQYVGFSTGGKKFIYGNFYPGNDEAKDAMKPVIVCDGGPRFWGIVYDVTHDSILQMNGNGAL